MRLVAALYVDTRIGRDKTDDAEEAQTHHAAHLRQVVGGGRSKIESFIDLVPSFNPNRKDAMLGADEFNYPKKSTETNDQAEGALGNKYKVEDGKCMPDNAIISQVGSLRGQGPKVSPTVDPSVVMDTKDVKDSAQKPQGLQAPEVFPEANTGDTK